MVQRQPTGSEKEANMFILGVITIRAFNKLLLSIQKAENCERRDWLTERKRRSSTVAWRLPVGRYVSVWKPADTHAGSNDCGRSCSLSCGWEMRRRYGVNAGANQRQIGKMRCIFWVCCGRMIFRSSGCRAGRIAICGNGYGIGTVGCKHAPAS